MDLRGMNNLHVNHTNGDQKGASFENNDKKRDPAKSYNGEKKFTMRNSLLTDLLNVNHIRSLYNLALAVLIIVISRTLLNDFFDEGSLNFKFESIIWSFGKLHVAAAVWTCMLSSTMFFAYPCLRYWAHIDRPLVGVIDKLWLVLYIVYITLLLILPPYFIIRFDVPFTSTFITLCEQLRISMKIYGFVREVVPRAIAYKKSISHKSDEKDPETPCPSYGQFLYFMFAPTLIYRDSYPRTKRINSMEVLKNLFQAVASWFAISFIISHFCIPEFQTFKTRHVTFNVLIRAVFNSILPAAACYVLNFFAVLHCWHNMFAELLTFGDRLFYRDWWNATNLASFYRDWNVIVHDWLYAYVYRDIQLIFRKNGSRLAAVAVFFVSAVFHEYIITVALRFFYPVLFFQFFVGTVPIFYVMKACRRQSGNVFLWWAIFVGNGMYFCLYSLEWYCRDVYPPTHSYYLDLIIPRSWSCLSSFDTK